jgi:hypothetical protein
MALIGLASEDGPPPDFGSPSGWQRGFHNGGCQRAECCDALPIARNRTGETLVELAFQFSPQFFPQFPQAAKEKAERKCRADDCGHQQHDAAPRLLSFEYFSVLLNKLPNCFFLPPKKGPPLGRLKAIAPTMSLWPLIIMAGFRASAHIRCESIPSHTFVQVDGL